MVKSKSELKSMYDSESYVDMYEKKPLSRLLNLVKYMNLMRNQNVVDFACGNALLLEIIKDSVSTYTGVDYSRSLINAAIKRKERLRVDNVEFICGEIVEFCEANQNSFDVAFAMDLSEHLLDEDWIEILLGIKKTLRKNGLLYMHTPNGEFFLEKIKKNGLLVKQLPGHIAVRTPFENKRMLQEAGFTVKETKLIPHYNILRYVHLLSHTPFIGKYLKARVFIEAMNGAS
jgi:2-polyprenyl-6-hydroxyphenyl methylase / 3-demethylubiquinone-9 3-methyltransferase